LEHIQQKWAFKMRFLIAPKPQKTVTIGSSIVLSVSPWRKTDWIIFNKNTLSAGHLKDERLDNLSELLAHFITEHNLHFSPELVQKCLLEYNFLSNIKNEEIKAKYNLMSKVCQSIDKAHESYDQMIIKCEESKSQLEQAIKRLEELKDETDVCLNDYRTQFDATLETERKFKELEHFVNELRIQTDTNSQFHPLFERAQSVLQTLDSHDFEEIRTYRKPPASVVLVVEAVCILFNEPATWDSGTNLLHRENFFQELEFFEKESVSPTAFQKLQHRLNRVDEREVKKASTAALGLLHWLEAIAGFSTTYSKMLPIINQLGKAENDLSQIQAELGRSRVNLDDLKNKFDLVDKQRLEQTELVQKLQSKIRHQKTELESLPIFLENLEFCSDRWRQTLADLEYMKYGSDIEMLIALMNLFLIGRFSYDTRQYLLESCHAYAKTKFSKLSDISGQDKIIHYSRLLTTNIFGDGGKSTEIMEKYLKYRNIEFLWLDWTSDPGAFPSDIVINKIQDIDSIQSEWYTLVCERQFSDFVKQENIHKWNDQMITKEIGDLEDRLFSDIIEQKLPLIELRELRKIVEKRKKAKTEWKTTLSHNNSLANDQIIRREKFATLIAAAMDCVEIFKFLEGRLFPSRYVLIKAILSQLPPIKTFDVETIHPTPLLSIFFSSMLSNVSAICSKSVSFRFKTQLALRILRNRGLIKDIAILDEVCTNGFSKISEIKLSNVKHKITNEIEEWCKDSNFTPFVPCWQNDQISADDLSLITCLLDPENGQYRLIDIYCKAAFGLCCKFIQPNVKIDATKIIILSKNGESIPLGPILDEQIENNPFLVFDKGIDVKSKSPSTAQIVIGERIDVNLHHNSLTILEKEECLKGHTLDGFVSSEHALQPTKTKQIVSHDVPNCVQTIAQWVSKDLLVNLPRTINAHLAFGLLRIMTNSNNPTEMENIKNYIMNPSTSLRITLNKSGEAILALLARHQEKQQKTPIAFVNSLSAEDDNPLSLILDYDDDSYALEMVPLSSILSDTTPVEITSSQVKLYLKYNNI